MCPVGSNEEAIRMRSAAGDQRPKRIIDFYLSDGCTDAEAKNEKM
jgi:hypothetical protein